MPGLDFAQVVNAIVLAHNVQADPAQRQASNAILSQVICSSVLQWAAAQVSDWGQSRRD